MRLNKRHLLSSLSTLVLMASVCGTSGVYAQDDDGELEEIVVTGIRASLDRALDTKKNAKGFVDSVSSTDIGKLPDQNVAEALQRVTGVTIQRSRGEGDFVSIRGLGPDFVRGTINGRTILSATESVDPIFNGNLIQSTGRAVNFDILPSEVVRQLNVVKSTTAGQVEGGIGGTVDLQTARPLELGNKIAVSAQGTYREFNDQVDPAISGLYSWENKEGTFGALFSAQYSERTLREDVSRTFGHFESFGISSQLDTNDDGIGDASPSDVPFSLSNNLEAVSENRDRYTFTGALQWRSDDLEIVADALYSRRELREVDQNLIFLPIIFDGDLAGRTVNPDGSVQVGDLVTDGVFSQLPTSLRPELTTDIEDLEDDLFAVGVNAEYRTGAWTLVGDLSYSRATGSQVFDRVRIDGDNGVFAFNTIATEDGFNITQTNAGAGPEADLSNPANYVVSVLDDRFAENTDEEWSASFDARRDIESDFLSSIEMGVRFRSRDKGIERASNGNGIPVVGAGLDVQTLGSFNRGASNFLDGTLEATFDFADLVFPDNAAIRSNQTIIDFINQSGLSTAIAADPFTTFSVKEDTYAGFFQVNLDANFGGIEVVGDIGFRIVNTRQTVNGFDASFTITDNGGMDTTIFDTLSTGAATPVQFTSNYTNVLPSLNLRFELDDNLYLRVAANETITRPVFNSLAPSFAVNANGSINGGDNFAVAVNAGNPALEPVTATNYDLGIEWYFDDTSAVYIGLFHKEIDGFVATAFSENVTELAGVPIRAFGVEQDGTTRPIAVDQLSQPGNQGVAQVTGVEFGLQQAFSNGFGYSANVTLVDSSAELQTTGEVLDFPGVSDFSYNLTGFYEKGPLQARVAYTFRSDFLFEPTAIGFGGQIFTDDFGQLDASISYDVTENVSVFVNAVNLTDEQTDFFQILPAGQRVFNSRSVIGRRFVFGVRASF
ncbi:TonB-dependent receptor [Kordiimonas sp. SCSIO 12610]|uniref:TonB-dependent receptor n=1 Tax=Kordiimonas sp. SCSIO 12610 TaxID=2829597 RepID=UPI0021095E5B|nr:TonB-dependent receptor [Kordiimonas sp. SCSIO 12610]UTW54693.1 TonB-dependent receptor [Kordiimonas sp. SCSIO 12610]